MFRKVSVWLGAAVVAGAVGYFNLPEEAVPQQGDGYFFVIYPVELQTEIDAMGIVSLGYRSHPDGEYRLSNKDGNVAMDSTEIAALNGLDGVLFVPSDRIAEYLDENGWNAGGEL